MAVSRFDIDAGVDRLMYWNGQGHILGFPSRPGSSSAATTGVPTNGIQGFVPGAVFVNYKGGKGTTFYLNVGTFASATWVNVDGALFLGLAGQANVGTNSVVSSSTTPTYTAAQLTGFQFVTLLLTGSPGGGVTGTMDTTANILAALPFLRVGYSWRLRVLNHGLAQTVTLTAGDGSTVISGTATIATNTWRDFDVVVATATTLTLQSVGVGTES